MSFETFRIPTERVKELQERVAKLNKKAAKLGTPPINLVVTDKTEEVTVKVGGTMALRMGTKYTYEVTEVLLRGETPKLNGWEFLSVVMYRPAGNEFVNLTDNDADLSEFVFTDKHCDHCGKKRVRNATFLVRHEDGQIKQVGSTCLTDYTGVKSPQAVARQMENIFDMFREIRGWGATAGRTTRKFFLVEWLAFVSMEVRKRGYYVGRDRAQDTGDLTTGERAKTAILNAVTDPNAVVPTDEDFAAAQKWIDWVRSDEGHEVMEKLDSRGGDFGMQLLAACKSDDADAVSESTMNIVAPVAAFYNRAQADKDKPVSEFQGTVKDKLTQTLKVTRTFGYQTDYGWTYGYEFIDRTGNVYVWKASKDHSLEVDTCYKLTGTVKAHDEFRGSKQTILTRCKVDAVVGRAS